MKALASTAVVLAAGAGVLSYAVSDPRSQLFGRSVYRGKSRRRSVALTFDDGPSPASEHLRTYLAKESISATFFQCGQNVERHPEITLALADSGHELANHTFNHRRLSPRLGWKLNLLSAQVIYEELESTQRAILGASGRRPVLFRAPYGLRWFGLSAAQMRLQLTGVMWTTMPHDWEWESERITQHVLAQVSPGAIICMHDGRDTRERPDVSTTLTAVKQLIPRLKDLGYSFERVSDLIRLRSPAEAIP